MREQLLIVRHFLRRLVENDLISPEADRHEVLGVACAALMTTGLVGTVFISVKYQFSPLQLPGWTSLAALDDMSLFVGASMIVMALVAVSEWDALGLDARDASILGPLPLPPWLLLRAKLAAIALFSVAFAVALNAIPSVIYPILLSSKLPISLAGLLTLMAAHLCVTAAAGAFGFLGIVALRELLRVMAGATLFGRVSSVVQATVLVGLATTLLLLPRLFVGSVRELAEPRQQRPAQPAACLVCRSARVDRGRPDRRASAALPFRGRAEPRRHRSARERADAELPQPPDAVCRTRPHGAHRLAAVAIVAFGLSAWNARRLPAAAASRAARHGQVRLALDWLVRRVLSRPTAVCAGRIFLHAADARTKRAAPRCPCGCCRRQPRRWRAECQGRRGHEHI